jgi:hypothetical protein
MAMPGRLFEKCTFGRTRAVQYARASRRGVVRLADEGHFGRESRVRQHACTMRYGCRDEFVWHNNAEGDASRADLDLAHLRNGQASAGGEKSYCHLWLMHQ